MNTSIPTKGIDKRQDSFMKNDLLHMLTCGEESCTHIE